MKKENYIILALVGIGIYFYYKSKKNTTTSEVKANNNPSIPVNDTGVPIPQTLDLQTNQNLITAHFSLSGYKKKLGNIPNTI